MKIFKKREKGEKVVIPWVDRSPGVRCIEMSYAIQTEQLSKTYANGAGCREVSLAVEAGQVFGCLGPNGAGKSTLVKTLLGLLHPTGGTGTVLGQPLGTVSIRRHIGYLPELFRYHGWLTGEELLHLHGRLYRMKEREIRRRIPLVLEQVGLSGREKEKVASYSKGMQQRIGLGCALVNDPDLLFLDEPTSALDPIGRREVRGLLQQLKREGKTIFLNSHLLSEVESVCDALAILSQGRVVVQGTWKELQVGPLTGRITVLPWDEEQDRWLKEQSAIQIEASAFPKNRQVRDKFQDDDIGTQREQVLSVPFFAREEMADWIAVLIAQRFRIVEAEFARPSLEELFFQWVERGTELAASKTVGFHEQTEHAPSLPGDGKGISDLKKEGDEQREDHLPINFK